LALLLTSAASKATEESLGLVGYSSNGVLHPLDGLPGLVGYLARSLLRPSALLLGSTTLGLRGAGFLYGLLGLGGRRNLQVEEAAIRTELQATSLLERLVLSALTVASTAGAGLLTFPLGLTELMLMAPLELVLTLPFLVPDPVRLVALCAICSITFLGFGTRFNSFP
jgi:hypothetical protein